MKILFSNEIGSGWGHIAKLLPIAEQLQDLGHTVYLSTRTHSPVKTTVPYIRVPKLIFCPKIPWEQPYSNFLKRHGGDVYNRDSFYISLFTEYKPDLIIINHSPFAHKVANDLNIPVIFITEGYECPEDYPYKSIKTLFATFPEFDCYGPRNAEYIGPIGKFIELDETIEEDVFLYVKKPKKFGREKNSVYNKHIPKLCITHGIGTASYFILKGVPVQIIDTNSMDVILFKKHLEKQNIVPSKIQNKYSWFNQKNNIIYVVDIICRYKEFL